MVIGKKTSPACPKCKGRKVLRVVPWNIKGAAKGPGKNGPVGIANTSGWGVSGKKHRASRTATLGHIVARVNFNPIATFQQDDSTCPAPRPSYDPSVHQLQYSFARPDIIQILSPKSAMTQPRQELQGGWVREWTLTSQRASWIVPWTPVEDLTAIVKVVNSRRDEGTMWWSQRDLRGFAKGLMALGTLLSKVA